MKLLPWFENRILIFMGMFGSGKTEIALNVAFHLKESFEKVAIADIDVISPYFRSRDHTAELEKKGIKVITPPGQLMHADLPIISPAVRGFIENNEYRLVLDVGGNDDGAVVLGSLSYLLKKVNVSTFFVINPFRPFTDTVQKTVEHIERLSSKARMKIDYLINNANLGNETTPENVKYGEKFIKEVSKATEIPVAMTIVIDGLKEEKLQFPVFNLKKHLKTPWEV
ncbi:MULTISPECIES: cobyric acid synthase CobQ [Kosmotoga]|uniref:Cobalamin biosynthesis protein CobQ n=1 Tax=Kosmotoga olearia (strain ATCC BAA-1733 / DSM 21960 / TBF 19.5.1) TaxID=521045 RepID=C5CIQ6_KOSOT|nr:MULTISPECIES: cobyric acid synthase CobQ [Kosmotoga]ACR80839.1 conserved hypothetical protein [Kosmotoga olearia TBF 19.5.1]MDI3524540.1 hypothetical protein [Kosmotoga sp.]MDK2952677.1 hypothetical protein [Kosmotoga sp.]OAA19274.1 cobalamin biosynthesis protein CobQ [Kosmotoga sp. DU53]